MASSHKKSLIMPADMLYLATFSVGMAAFWLGGHASEFLPRVQNAQASIILGMATTASVYGLGMLILTLLVTRRFGKAVIVATILAVAFGLAAAQVILRLAAGHINTTNDIAFLTFVLYLVYGGIYVIGLAIARKIAK